MIVFLYLKLWYYTYFLLWQIWKTYTHIYSGWIFFFTNIIPRFPPPQPTHAEQKDCLFFANFLQAPRVRFLLRFLSKNEKRNIISSYYIFPVEINPNIFRKTIYLRRRKSDVRKKNEGSIYAVIDEGCHFPYYFL